MWVRLDDAFADHPKLLAAGPLALAIQVRALCYAARHLTDGFLPAEAMPTLLTGVEEIASARAIDTMVKHHLWEIAPGGYTIHDYLHFQPSRKAILQARRKKVKAGRLGGIAKGIAFAKHGAREKIYSRTHPVRKESTTESKPTAAAPPSASPPAPAIIFTINDRILSALDRSPHFGPVARLRQPAFWQAEIRANPSVDMAGEILKAEAWITANPKRAPRSDLARFLHTWLSRADREE